MEDATIQNEFLRAVFHNNIERVQELINDHGVTGKCKDGYTPIHMAATFTCRSGDTSITDLLLKNGANINPPKTVIGSPLSLAICENIYNVNWDMIRYLIEIGADYRGFEWCGGFHADEFRETTEPIEQMLRDIGEEVEFISNLKGAKK